MSRSQKQSDFELQAKRLIGQRLVVVRYFEIVYDDHKPCWKRKLFDSLDHGFDLEVETGRVFSITWDWAFVSYGLVVHDGSLADFLLNYAKWDVSRESGRADLIGSSIRSATVYWAEHEDKGSRIPYPQDIVLTFSTGKRVFLSAAMYMEQEDKLFGMSDEVTVIFDEDTTRRYQVGPYRSK